MIKKSGHTSPVIISTVLGVFIVINKYTLSTIPFELLYPLVFASFLTSMLISFLPAKEDSIFNTSYITEHLHLILSIVGTMSFILSAWEWWIRPFILIFAITGTLTWHPFLYNGCPFTYLEAKLRLKRGERTNLENYQFVPYYIKKWFGIYISERTFLKLVGILAVLMLTWWGIDFLTY